MKKRPSIVVIYSVVVKQVVRITADYAKLGSVMWGQNAAALVLPLHDSNVVTRLNG